MFCLSAVLFSSLLFSSLLSVLSSLSELCVNPSLDLLLRFTNYQFRISIFCSHPTICRDPTPNATLPSHGLHPQTRPQQSVLSCAGFPPHQPRQSLAQTISHRSPRRPANRHRQRRRRRPPPGPRTPRIRLPNRSRPLQRIWRTPSRKTSSSHRPPRNGLPRSQNHRSSLRRHRRHRASPRRSRSGNPPSNATPTFIPHSPPRLLPPALLPRRTPSPRPH